MRLRFAFAFVVGVLALAVSACMPGGPVAGGTPASTISANVHNNTRLAPGSCGSPAVPPNTIIGWVGSATGMVRGKVLKLTRGPTSPSNVTLQIDIQVGTVHGDTFAFPGQILHGQITIWNQPGEDAGWDAWGKPLTFERFDDTMEAILPVIGQFGDYVGGRLCYPIMFGTPTEGAFLSGTKWGTLDEVADVAGFIVDSR